MAKSTDTNKSQKDLEDVLFVIDELLNDATIPKNVKNTLGSVKDNLSMGSSDVIKLTESIYLLQDISEDVNLPLNAKSDVWLLQSKIEKLKEGAK